MRPLGRDLIKAVWAVEPPWPAIREWIPADDTDPQAVFPEDINSTHWVPTEIRLDDDRTLVLNPS